MARTVNKLLLMFIVAAVLSGCGGGKSAQPIASSGNTTGFVTDSAADGVLALRADITSAEFKSSDGNSVAVTGLPQHVELRHLELAPGVLFQTYLPPLTYTSLILTLSNVEIDGTSQSGGVQKFTSSTKPGLFSQKTVNVPIDLTIPPETKPGLMIDFDLANSLTNDASGNYLFTPVVHVERVEIGGTGWQLGAARGRIRWISSSPPSLTVKFFDSGLTLTFGIDNNTFFSPAVGSLAGLKVGQAVEMYARFENGAYVASYVDPAADPTASDEGIVVGTPTLDSTPLSILLQN